MEAVLEEAEAAKERADATRKEVDEAREQVRYLAVATYTSNGLDPALSILLDPNPQEIIDTVSIVDHLSHTNNDKISYLLEAMERDEKAQANAEEKLEEAEADLEELEERRWEVRRLIAKYPVQEMTPPDNLTPRTRQMRDLIIEKFGRNDENGGVGCYRPNGGWVVGEHPKGGPATSWSTPTGRCPPRNSRRTGKPSLTGPWSTPKTSASCTSSGGKRSGTSAATTGGAAWPTAAASPRTTTTTCTSRCSERTPLGCGVRSRRRAPRPGP